jgi:VWFA-related protein
MLRSVVFFLLAVFTAVLAVSYYSAQAGAYDPQNPPIIRTTSRVVNVYVVATDHEGRPMERLNKDDFQVFDNGLPKEIAFFSTREDKAAESTGVGSLAPGEYSNHLELSATANEGLTVILFDTINTAYLSQAYGLGKIRIYLRQLHPEDRVGIYALNREGLQVVYPMDQRASALLQVMQRYDEGYPAKVGNKAAATAENGTGLVELDRFLRGKYDHQPMRICDPERFLITIAALQEIARSTIRFRGRKAIIWVTEHISLPYEEENGLDIARLERFCRMDYDPDLILEQPGNLRPLPGLPRSRSVEPGGSPPGLRTGPAQTTGARNRGLSGNDELDIVLRLLTQNNIALYPVSAEGLQTLRLFGPGDAHPGAPLPPKGMDATAQLSPVPGAMTEKVLGAADAVANVESHQAFEDLARRTGGRAYYDRNDLETGIRRALDDAKYGYELAYYPDHDRWNGDWHKITVKVNRPDVTVLARGGYYAFPEPELLPPKASKQLLEEIAASPLEDTEIPITVKLPPPASLRSATIEARVFVDPQTLFASQPGVGWKSDFEVLFFQLTSKNKILDVTTESVDLNLADAKYSKALKEGFDTLATLQLKAGATILYVLVHDKRTDAAGSVRIPLDGYKATP